MEAGLEVTISRSKFLASIFWRKPLNQQIICFAMKVLKGCCFPLLFLKPFYSGNGNTCDVLGFHYFKCLYSAF